jgi:hypothetical protein
VLLHGETADIEAEISVLETLPTSMLNPGSPNIPVEREGWPSELVAIRASVALSGRPASTVEVPMSSGSDVLRNTTSSSDRWHQGRDLSWQKLIVFISIDFVLACVLAIWSCRSRRERKPAAVDVLDRCPEPTSAATSSSADYVPSVSEAVATVQDSVDDEVSEVVSPCMWFPPIPPQSDREVVSSMKDSLDGIASEVVAAVQEPIEDEVLEVVASVKDSVEDNELEAVFTVQESIYDEVSEVVASVEDSADNALHRIQDETVNPDALLPEGSMEGSMVDEGCPVTPNKRSGSRGAGSNPRPPRLGDPKGVEQWLARRRSKVGTSDVDEGMYSERKPVTRKPPSPMHRKVHKNTSEADGGHPIRSSPASLHSPSIQPRGVQDWLQKRPPPCKPACLDDAFQAGAGGLLTKPVPVAPTPARCGSAKAPVNAR